MIPSSGVDLFTDAERIAERQALIQAKLCRSDALERGFIIIEQGSRPPIVKEGSRHALALLLLRWQERAVCDGLAEIAEHLGDVRGDVLGLRDEIPVFVVEVDAEGRILRSALELASSHELQPLEPHQAAGEA